MDINTVCLSGHLYNIRSYQTNSMYPKVEARISVNNGKDVDGQTIYADFYVQSFGKKNTKILSLAEGTFVTIQGRLRKLEKDITERSAQGKVFIVVDTLKAHDMKED